MTRSEAIDWQQRNPVRPGDPLSDLCLSYYEFCAMDDTVAVVAFDGEHMVGRNLVFLCNILVNGEPLKCAVSHNLYVDEAYRSKAVGTFIKMHVLKLGYPQISSGLSGAQKQVLDKWNAYQRVEDAKIYSMPLDFNGIVRLSRLAYYRAIDNGASHLPALMRSLVNAVAIKPRLSSATLVDALDAETAREKLDGVLDDCRFNVQLPWNRSKLRAAISGQLNNMKAWVVPIAGQLRLITIYLKYREARVLGNAARTLCEAHVNEVFPPVAQADEVRQVIKFCARQMQACQASILQVHALNEVMADSCQHLKLNTFLEKTVYIAPNKAAPDIAAIITDRQNWWCRAINEDQFEEVADGVNV